MIIFMVINLEFNSQNKRHPILSYFEKKLLCITKTNKAGKNN